MEDREEAVPFLIYDLNTRIFTLTEQAEEVIKNNFNSKFGVISVAGMYRTGKSYLLNRMLLNRQKGFSVGPTVNPCTKGLWIWSKPIYATSEDGSRFPVLLIDTEGFGAFDEDQNHDIRIFTLSILLSSFFVYNSIGSIDENALQNLNFVINLSKHIQLSGTQKYSDTNPDELANIFPSFLWVLRDFSLQLIDDNGECITAKEYLEKVLDINKSCSDHEQKNKIRKLIKTFFKDRDCFTMVRPLTKENELQSLENLGPGKLRPEFLEQILALRKKILTRVKVKTLNGKPLNSDMYINYIKSLITSINSGKIPNIETTWISMCKVESYKAFEEAERVYENYIKESLESSNLLPNEENLRQIHLEAKEASLVVFKRKALGDYAGEYLKLLKSKIKEKFSYYSKLQEENMKGKIIRVLNKWYSIIECRMQGEELKTVEDIEGDFKSMELKLNEIFGSFPLRGELFNDFKSKVLLFAGDFFNNKAKNELKLIKNENSQVILKLTNDLNDTKMLYDKEISKRNELIEQYKIEIKDLKDQLNLIKENLAVTAKEKEILGKNLNLQINRQKDEYERKLQELGKKMASAEEKHKESERKAITSKADCEREKALLEQKVENLSKLIEEYSKREKENGIDAKSQLKEQGIAFKEKIGRYEQALAEVTRGNEICKEKIVDLESNLSNYEQLYQNEKRRADDLQVKLNADTKELSERITSLKIQVGDEKNKQQEDFKMKEVYLNSQVEKLKTKNENFELIYKNSEDNYKSQIAKQEKENAIILQENGFLKSQNQELTSSIEEQKRNYENIVETLENKAFQMLGHEEFQKKVDQIKQYFDNEMKQNEENFEKAKLIYVNQMDTLTEKLNECEFKNKIYREDTERQLNDSKAKYDKILKDYNNLINEKKKLQDSLMNTSNEVNSKLKIAGNEMEKKLEEKEHTHQKELCELNKNSEDTISQMKALFETEKIRYEEKFKEEKIKTERKIRNTIEEYESKMKETETELKEENEKLQNEINDLENIHTTYVTSSEREIEILRQRISTLEEYLKEAKESLANFKIHAANSLDKATDSFNKERKDLQMKIDTATCEVNLKEKEIASIQMKRDQMEKLIDEKNSVINAMRKEYSDERKENCAKIELYKTKYTESSDEFMVKKLEYTRENALLKQQVEFLNKKIEETAKQFEDNQTKYEDKLFSLRAEVEKDLTEKFDRAKKEKEDLDTKLLNKKKEIKELEQTFNKQYKLLEKEKSELIDKNSANGKKIQELSDLYEKDITCLNKTIQNITKENSQMKENLLNGNDFMKKRVSALEMELAEKNAAYEKEQILWEGKNKFVEQQRDSFKKDLTEASKRFENLLESIQKKGNLEKEKIETSTQNAITALEQKYQTQIKELQESHSKLCLELLNNNRELDRELKSLTMQNEIYKGKALDPSVLSKKLEQYSQEKEKLTNQIEELKKEREVKTAEWQANLEKEKESLKAKITDTENRLREAEGKRGSILFEYEREKAKWQCEKDHMESKTVELQDSLERLEKKNETLLKENEKLKSERACMKRSASIKASQSQQALNNYSIVRSGSNSLSSSFIGGGGGASGKDSPSPSLERSTSTFQQKIAQGISRYQKEIDKIFGDKAENMLDMNLNLNLNLNSSKIEKSFEKYDSSRYDNPYQVKSTSKYGMRPIMAKKEEANGNSSSSDLNLDIIKTSQIK